MACLGLAFMAGALTSCAPSVEPPPAVHAATYDAQGEGGDGALLIGKVSHAGSCLTVETRAGPVLPLFPADEISNEEEHIMFRGELLREGEQVSLGGGEGMNLASFREQTIVEIPHTCNVDVPFWVVSQQD